MHDYSAKPPIIQAIFKPHTDLEAIHHYSFKTHFTHLNFRQFYAIREFLDEGADSGQHCHDDFYVLTVIRAGHGVSIINGYSYNVMRGDVFIISPGTIHSVRDYQGIELDAFYFQANLFNRTELAALRKLKGFWKLLMPDQSSRTNDACDPRLHLSPERQREVEELVLHIHHDLHSNTPLGALLARHQFFCLLARFGAVAHEYS